MALDWLRSSYSGSSGGHCVEVAASGDGLVHIRHSRQPRGRRLTVSAGTWRQFLAGIRSGTPGPGPGLTAAPGDGTVVLRDAHRPGSPGLAFTLMEWQMFGLGVADGEFTMTSDDRLPAAGAAKHPS